MRRPWLRVALVLGTVTGTLGGLAPSAPAIIGGEVTKHAWPWMVTVQHGRHDHEVRAGTLCGGTVIAPTWVLTAAHCIETPDVVEPHLIYVIVGRHRFDDQGTGETIQGRAVIRHPGYDDLGPAKGRMSGGDVALIELERPTGRPTVAIAGPGEEPLWASGVAGTVLGWGATDTEGNFSYELKEGRLQIARDAECAAAYPTHFQPEVMVCAGDRGRTATCSGDSGGPLLVPTALGWRQAGVTSWGPNPCNDPDRPPVFARAAGGALREWIARYVPEAIGRPEPPVPTAPSPPSQPAPASAPASSDRAGAGSERRRKVAKPQAARARRAKCLKRAKTRAARRRCHVRYRRAVRRS